MIINDVINSLYHIHVILTLMQLRLGWRRWSWEGVAVEGSEGEKEKGREEDGATN